MYVEYQCTSMATDWGTLFFLGRPRNVGNTRIWQWIDCLPEY